MGARESGLFVIGAVETGINVAYSFGKFSAIALIGFGVASRYNTDPDISRASGYLAAAFVIPGGIYFVVSGALFLSSLRKK